MEFILSTPIPSINYSASEDVDPGERDSGNGNCLICHSSKTSDHFINHSHSSASFSQPPLLSKSVYGYFILKHVLELPSEQLKNYLRMCPSPENWVQICHSCGENYVSKCQRIFTEMMEVQKRFTEARMEVIEAIKRSVQGEALGGYKEVEAEEMVLDICKEIRKFVVQKNYSSPDQSDPTFFLGSDLTHSQKAEVREALVTPPDTEDSSKEEEAVKEEPPSPPHPPTNNDDPLEFPNLVLGVDVFNQSAGGFWNENDDEEDIKPAINLEIPPTKKKSPIIKRRRDSRIYTCSTCQFKSPKMKELLAHRKRKHVKIPKPELQNFPIDQIDERKPKFTCTEEGCPQTFSNERLLLAHLRNHPAPITKHEGPYKCDQCEFESQRKWQLKDHIKLAHFVPPEIKPFPCLKCYRSYNDKTILRRHMIKMHNIDPSKKAKREREKLLKEVLKDVDFSKCFECGLHIPLKHELERHLEVFHGRNPKEIKCPHCDRTETSRWTLCKHIQAVHEKSIQFCCDQCGAILADRSGLTSHIKRVHAEDTSRFKCPEEGCDKSFPTQKQLTRHRNSVHLKLWTLQCEMCGKYFYSGSHLRSHIMAMHTNRESKPFKCDVCGKGFAVKEYMNLHKRKVHLRKPPKGKEKKPEETEGSCTLGANS